MCSLHIHVQCNEYVTASAYSVYPSLYLSSATYQLAYTNVVTHTGLVVCGYDIVEKYYIIIACGCMWYSALLKWYSCRVWYGCQHQSY